MPAPQVMSRPAGYRYGSWLALHGSGAHLVGFSTSCWLSQDGNPTQGLWARCQDTRCSRLSPDDIPGWYMASRVLSCVGVVLLVMWLLVGCQCKCLRSRQQRHRWLTHLEEVLAILAGCISLLSVGVFAVASRRDRTFTDFSLGWSLWLMVGGASACTLGGFIVAATRSSAHPAPKPCSRSVVRPVNSSPAMGVAGSQGRGQDTRERADPRRRADDVSEIFNVASYAARSSTSPSSSALVGGSHAGIGCRTLPPGLVETAVPPPPPYSVRDLDPGVRRDGSDQTSPQRGEEPSTQMYELSISPPPSYEAAMNEPPPPYEPRPDYPPDRQTVIG
ncbi:uncharacterized protein LOC143293173 [Babylonia areolata]|uniref:uncharacterized protein LOC143293173 n=1 Tax=Babylonia areolata TaxID=304850 RepID=UPI003FD4244E